MKRFVLVSAVLAAMACVNVPRESQACGRFGFRARAVASAPFRLLKKIRARCCRQCHCSSCTEAGRCGKQCAPQPTGGSPAKPQCQGGSCPACSR